MSKPDRVTAALTKLLDNADPAVVATAAGKLTDLRIAKMGTEKSENKVGPLRDEITALKKSLATAESALKTAQTALDAANAELMPLREQAAKFATMETEYVELKTNFDARIAAMRTELVAEAQRHAWDAARAENAAKETLKTAQAQFGARGQQILLDFVQKLVEQFSIPEPDTETLPAGISPLVLTLWGHTPIRAQLMIAYAKSFPTPDENFKNTLFRVLRAGLPIYKNMPTADPVPDLAVKREVLIAMAQRWNVLIEVQRRVDEEQVRRQGDAMKNQTYELHEQQKELARRGYGRTDIGVPQESETDPRFWNGYIPANPIIRPVFQEDDDINKAETIDYATQLIEREALAKRGKIVTVPPPDGYHRDHSPNDDGEAL
jgi:hypothetical protein